MSSLKRRVDQRQDALLARSNNIRQHGERLRRKLNSVGIELEKAQWKDGRIQVQINLRLTIAVLLAGIAALLLVGSRSRG